MRSSIIIQRLSKKDVILLPPDWLYKSPQDDIHEPAFAEASADTPVIYRQRIRQIFKK